MEKFSEKILDGFQTKKSSKNAGRIPEETPGECSGEPQKEAPGKSQKEFLDDFGKKSWKICVETSK